MGTKVKRIPLTHELEKDLAMFASRRYAQKHTYNEIASRFNEEGLETWIGTLWSTRDIADLIRRYKKGIRR